MLCLYGLMFKVLTQIPTCSKLFTLGPKVLQNVEQDLLFVKDPALAVASHMLIRTAFLLALFRSVFFSLWSFVFCVCG